MLVLLEWCRCSWTKVVRVIKRRKQRVRQKNLVKKRCDIRLSSTLLRVFIHLFVRCHYTLHFHLPTTHTKPFPSFLRNVSPRPTKSIFRTRWSTGHNTSRDTVFIRLNHNGFQPQYQSFLCIPKRTSYFPYTITKREQNLMSTVKSKSPSTFHITHPSRWWDRRKNTAYCILLHTQVWPRISEGPKRDVQ